VVVLIPKTYDKGQFLLLAMPKSKYVVEDISNLISKFIIDAIPYQSELL